MRGLGQEAIVAWGGCPNLTPDLTHDMMPDSAPAWYDMEDHEDLGLGKTV